MTVEELLPRLQAARRTSRGYLARCPAHDDNSPSLSITERDGKILLHCFAGCGVAVITEALGVPMKDLFTDNSYNEAPGRIAKVYAYHDEAGSVLYQTVRYEPKGFKQRRPDGNGGWIWDLKDTRRVLYRLPNILQETESPIVLHEGEKAVEASLTASLPGCHTTTVGGAKNAKQMDFTPVKGKAVIVVPDNDSSGEDYLRDAADMAAAAGASSVKVLRLQGLPPKGDVVEWLQAGGTAAAFAALLEQAEPVEGATIQAAPMAVSRVIFRRVADVQAQPIRWLWPGRIAQGKVSIIAGNPGLGKSQVTVGMAATISTGGLWPVDGKRCEVGNVIILSAEDDPSDTIRPRLEASAADLSRVYILDAVLDGPLVSGGETPRAFNLKTDIDQLGSMLKEIGGAALVIIDPITAYLGTTDSHKNAEIRALLSPLAELAGQYGTAVVAVSHFNKNANTEALMRVTGSLAFVAAARAAYVVARDPENEARRLFLPLKNNLGNDQSGLAFTVESAQVESAIGMIETSRVVWESSAVTVTAEEAMKPQVHDDERSDLDDAKDFLRELLTDGPIPSKQIRGDAEGAGHAWRTIQRAQKALGVVAFKKGMKEGWLWKLDSPSRSEECHEPPKNAVPGAWQSSYSSGSLGGLHGDDTVLVEGGGLGLSSQIAATSETPRNQNLYADDLMEVIDCDA